MHPGTQIGERAHKIKNKLPFCITIGLTFVTVRNPQSRILQGFTGIWAKK
jgi:hypothetical protein